MPFPVSSYTIKALAEIISGGPGPNYSGTGSIGIYRSGYQLEEFMRNLGFEFEVQGSRVPSLVECLEHINKGSNAEQDIRRIILAAADPRDFLPDQSQGKEVIDYLNSFLEYDKLELQHHGYDLQLIDILPVESTSKTLESKIDSLDLDLDNVKRCLDKARSAIDSFPDTTLTEVCSLLESLFKIILEKSGHELPKRQVLGQLYKETLKVFPKLNPGRDDLSPEIAEDVKKVLGGLHTVVTGIGSLRTHGGSAHGRGRGHVPIDSRIARLACNATECMALFFLETWEMQENNAHLNNRTMNLR